MRRLSYLSWSVCHGCRRTLDEIAAWGSLGDDDKRWVWQQYDHMVQTNTVEAPGAGDAGVIRIKGSKRGLANATSWAGMLLP